MSGYEFLKFLHVLAVIAWVGGGITILVLQTRLGSAGDRVGLMSVGRQMEGLGKLYFSPLALLTLVTGIWMVAATEGFSFGDPWILIGFGGIVLTSAVGIGLITPTGQKLLEESQRPEPDPAALASHGGRIRALAITNTAILVFVVWSMVTKIGA